MELLSELDANLTRIRELITERSFNEVENLWIEVVDDPEVASKVGDLVVLAQGLVDAGETGRAGACLELLLPALESGNASQESTVGLYELLVLLFPEQREYRHNFIERFEEFYGPSTAERVFFQCSGIHEAGNPGDAVRRMRRLARFAPGACVYHSSGWGIGEVLEVDPLLKQIRVDLEHKKNHRIALDAAESILEVIPEDGFRALLYRGGGEAERLAKEDPVDLVGRVLAGFGNPLPLKQIKSQLVPAVLAASGWSRWWNGTKALLRDSGFFRVGERAPYTVERFEKVRSYEEDLMADFRGGEWKVSRQVARRVLRGGAKKFPQAVPIVVEELVRIAKESRKPDRLAEIALLLARLPSDDELSAVIAGALSGLSPESLVDALETISQSEDLGKALEIYVATRPEHALSALQLSYRSRSDGLRTVACRLLEDRDVERLKALSAELLRSPRLGPEGLCWLLERKITAKNNGPALEPLSGLGGREIVGLLLDLVDYLVDRTAREARVSTRLKDALKRVETLLYHDKGSFFSDGIGDLSTSALRDIYGRLLRSAAHLPRYGLKLVECVSLVAPEIEKSDAEKHVWWDEDAIYVTADGLARRKEEFRVLMEEKIPANFEAVGKAADFGDLSENAEFTSALEEQTLLTKRAAIIEDDLKRARVLEPSDVQTGERTGGQISPVGLGHRVQCRDLDSGTDFVYSILGPWDGLSEDGILNYMSPLGQIFLGRERNEEFVAKLPGGEKRYQILDIRSHFE